LFVQSNSGPSAPIADFLKDAGNTIVPVDMPEFLRPDEFIMVDVPSAEGTIYIQDKKWEERVQNFEAILGRHECDVISKFVWEKGEDSHNYYVSCKQFVVEELVNHYGGKMGGAFEVELELKSGGWLTSKKMEITVPAATKDEEKSGLGWYKAVVEANAFEYLHNAKIADFTEMGKTKDIAGDKTLLLKNARAKIWVKPPGTEKRNAIYHTEVKYGDLQLKEVK
jgi:hypothetical protein